MKWYITLIIVLTTSFYGFGQGLHFLTSESAALKKAKLENKLIFIDVTADWCQPCKMMLREIESDSQVVGFMNRNFVNLQINEKLNKSFMKFHNIKGLPTVMYMSKDEIVLNKSVGYKGLNHLFENARMMQNLIKNYNAITSDETLQPTIFDEDKFIENVSLTLAQMTTETKNQLLELLLKKGNPYTRALLYNFESLVDYKLFDDHYKKIAKKGDLKLTEKLLIAHLNTDEAFSSNVDMKNRMKELAVETGVEERKMMSYILAYKEFYHNVALEQTTEQNLLVNAKNLLQVYPETTDIELLYSAFISVVKGEDSPSFFNNLDTIFTSLTKSSKDYQYYDILSIIHYVQGNPNYSQDISKANELAFAKKIKFVPSLKELRTIIDENRDKGSK